MCCTDGRLSDGCDREKLPSGAVPLKLLENFGNLTVLVRKVAIELNSESNVNFGEVVIYLMRSAQMLHLAYFQLL